MDYCLSDVNASAGSAMPIDIFLRLRSLYENFLLPHRYSTCNLSNFKQLTAWAH